MEEAIKNFPKQFLWEPEIENATQWKQFKGFILVGMGGSHLQGDIFQTVVPGFNLSVHQDYGLPPWPLSVLKETLVIASSYSGNTEETISAFQEAISRHIPVAAISVGGKLLDLAKQHAVPYIQIPDTGIQPRMALGFTFRALAKMVGKDNLLKDARGLVSLLKPEILEKRGKELAQKLQGKIPVLYASNRNYALAYNWKIKFNEGGKIPAFANVFPELNHTEMTGFDIQESTKNLSSRFHFILLKDSQDHPRIQKRMEVLTAMYKERGFQVETIELEGSSALERVFSSLLLADWTSFYAASFYGTDPELVPMVEEFKKLML